MQNQYSALEIYILRRSHPRRLLLDLIACNWAFYFIWNHAWDSAILVIIGFSLLGYYVGKLVSAEQMGETMLGKLALLHLHPVNLIVQLLGIGFLLYAVWMHSARAILAAISLILAGHLFGWSRIHKAFAVKESVSL